MLSFNEYTNNEHELTTTSSSFSASDQTPFSLNTDKAVQFQERDGALALHNQPGAGSISIILDCASVLQIDQVLKFQTPIFCILLME